MNPEFVKDGAKPRLDDGNSRGALRKFQDEVNGKANPGQKPEKNPKNDLKLDRIPITDQQQRIDDWRIRNAEGSNYNLPELLIDPKMMNDPVLQSRFLDHSIKQLGSKIFVEREAAMATLEQMGTAALPQLEKATHDKDPEISHRAQVLINRHRFREVLSPAKDLIKADQALTVDGGQDLPDNWKQVVDDFIKQAEKIDKSKLAKLPSSDKPDGLGNVNQLDMKLPGRNPDIAVEYDDLKRLNKITNSPRVECAKLLINCTGNNAVQKQERMTKAAELLGQALEKGEIKTSDSDFLSLRLRSDAINNPKFFKVYREAIIKANPSWQFKTDQEIKDLASPTNTKLR